MELEKQVCSLELAKRLKELGVEQNAYWSWVFNKGRYEKENLTYILKTQDTYNFTSDYGVKKGNGCWSAFSVAELGEMLKGETLPWWDKDHQGWRASYNVRCIVGAKEIITTEADARAKMLVYLLENKLLAGKE